MSKEQEILELLPGTTDEIVDRYARTKGYGDEVIGTPEQYNEVYGALYRLRKKGKATGTKVFAGNGAYTVAWDRV